MKEYIETVLAVGLIMVSVVLGLLILAILSIGFMVVMVWIDSSVKPFVGNGWSQLIVMLCMLVVVVIIAGTVIHFTGLNDKEVKE